MALYLQDHANDSQALTIKPSSHINGYKVDPSLVAEPLHPRKGDVVLFDSRLHHRGQERHFANFKRDPNLGMRTVVSLNYGRRNAFSRSHMRSFAMRNELVLNTSRCGGQVYGRCAKEEVRRDVRANPLF